MTASDLRGPSATASINADAIPRSFSIDSGRFIATFSDARRFIKIYSDSWYTVTRVERTKVESMYAGALRHWASFSPLVSVSITALLWRTVSAASPDQKYRCHIPFLLPSPEEKTYLSWDQL